MENILLEEINRMRKLMNLTEKENLEEDDSLTNNPKNDWIIQSLRKQLGGDKEIYVKLVDKRPGKEGKTRIVKQTVDGKILDISDDEPEEVNEGIKDKLKMGAICLILATGAVSCTKSGGGYGYNVSIKSVTHDLNKPNRTEEVTVVTPDGERTEMVNPGDTARFTWFSHGIYVKVKPTAEELQTAAFGAAIRREQSSNNGKGYPSNEYKSATVSEIKPNPGYTDGSSGEPAESIQDHEDYKVGRNAINDFPERWEDFKQTNPIKNYENL